MKIYYYKDLYRPWPYTLPEGYREAMRGKSAEEQLEYLKCTEYFRVAEKTSFDKPVHDEDDKLFSVYELGKKLMGALVDETDGTVIGIKVQCSGSQEPLFINDKVCIYSASDNNGAGYKYREDYIFLVTSPK
ncbi:MAG: hypothetical protein IJW21_04340 [Clostridia bacterium]|nr:hypothetical protein [Clostridia bacterium]